MENRCDKCRIMGCHHINPRATSNISIGEMIENAVSNTIINEEKIEEKTVKTRVVIAPSQIAQQNVGVRVDTAIADNDIATEPSIKAAEPAKEEPSKEIVSGADVKDEEMIACSLCTAKVYV